MISAATQRGESGCVVAGARRAVAVLVLAVIVLGGAGTSAAEGKQDSVQLPHKVNIRLMRTLERQLSDVEKALVGQAKLPKERVRNVTMSFQNFIDDVVLASGRYTDIYPRAIFDVLCGELKTTKPKTVIGNLLIQYHKSEKFKTIAESRESKSPKNGGAGT